MPRRLSEEISGLQACAVAHVEGMAAQAPPDATTSHQGTRGDAVASQAAPPNALPAWAVLLLTLWAVLIGSLLLWLGHYSMQEGDRGLVPRELDEPSGLVAHFFLHPQCPCSGASVEELDRLMTRLGAKSDLLVTAHVFEPENATNDWAGSEMVARLKRMPGVQVQMDPLGKQGETLGVKSSGHLLVYHDGVLRFSGGLTALRGHAGRSDSGEAAYLALTGEHKNEWMTDVDWVVFGCPILGDFPAERKTFGEPLP